jgi:hypothetical protein
VVGQVLIHQLVVHQFNTLAVAVVALTTGVLLGLELLVVAMLELPMAV